MLQKPWLKPIILDSVYCYPPRHGQAETMKEYNRLLDEQEGQRAMELAARMERPWALEERGE